MKHLDVGSCPMCGCMENTLSYPYKTLFNKQIFEYLKCSSCSTVFVFPTPDKKTFKSMYKKDSYHDCDYNAEVSGTYDKSVELLGNFCQINSSVLDYGCGIGGFLQSLRIRSFYPVGIEFDADAAKFASSNSLCDVYTIEYFFENYSDKVFDVIHFGDVIEHLPDPYISIKRILPNLRKGGILFIEGPIEENPSIVYWATKIYGYVKFLVKPGFVPTYPPYHLFRTGCKQQLNFFKRFEEDLQIKYYEVYESGWPYIECGGIKKIIAKVSFFFSGKFFGVLFGNRIKVVLIKK